MYPYCDVFSDGKFILVRHTRMVPPDDVVVMDKGPNLVIVGFSYMACHTGQFRCSRIDFAGADKLF